MENLGLIENGNDLITKNYLETILNAYTPNNNNEIILKQIILHTYDWQEVNYADYSFDFIDLPQENEIMLIQEISLNEISDNNIIIVNPDQQSFNDYICSNIKCIYQENGKLIFSCDLIPNQELIVNILIINTN